MPTSVTELLIESRLGTKDRADELFRRLHAELETVARRQLRARGGSTLDTSGLVNETYLRIVEQDRVDWKDRAHFFGYAAKAMRHVLVSRARRRTALKRGSGRRPVTFTEGIIPVDEASAVLIDLGDALEELEADEPRLAQVVDLRFFAGLGEQEAAEVLGVSARTVRRDWVKARAYLHDRLAV
ncbi:MAG: sigma-70 family RNA polymerase sigma factor [Gemmatimonadetes bacterium]|nr:sigma-70 family RNA polymerase sigma factor [Gemmatimonadota bacterium]